LGAGEISAAGFCSVVLAEELKPDSRRRLRVKMTKEDVLAKTLPHYVENTGTTNLRFLEMFKTNTYQDLALSEWFSRTPPELIAAHLNLDKATLDAIPRDNPLITPELFSRNDDEGTAQIPPSSSPWRKDRTVAIFTSML
jgi:hypothetical protein